MSFPFTDSINFFFRTIMAVMLRWIDPTNRSGCLFMAFSFSAKKKKIDRMWIIKVGWPILHGATQSSCNYVALCHIKRIVYIYTGTMIFMVSYSFNRACVKKKNITPV